MLYHRRRGILIKAISVSALMRGFAVLLATSCALGMAADARAQTFAETLELARNNEPTYLSAKASVTAAQEKYKQAFAGLLPQLSVSASANTNQRDYITRDSPIPPAEDRYRANSRTLNLTQPVWRHANFIATTQANLVIGQAEQQLAAAEQELLAKLITAWCDVMRARDDMVNASRQVDATRQQMEILRRGVQLGTASAPALEDARAKHNKALADRVSSEMEMQVKIAMIEQLAGPLRGFRAKFLSPRFSLQEPGDNSLDKWVEIAETGSPAVLAAEQAYAAAGEEVRKQRAGHEPTLDVVGSYGINSQTVGNFPGQNGYEIKQKTIGVQLNIPLYSGGGQNAKVGEAVAESEKARYDLEAARRAARLNAKQAWYLWQAGSARQVAALQGVKSSLAALDAALLGRNTGLKTELDVLQARQQLEEARRDLNRARYDMIIGAIRLKATAGKLTDTDVVELGKLFIDPEPAVEDLLAAN
jgi:outer membrane protein